MAEIRIGTLFPEDLNLNGDQANLLVLKKRLANYGKTSQIVEIDGPADLGQFSFVFLGHGPKAAWSSIKAAYPNLFADLKSAMEHGSFVFAVGSGYINLVQELSLELPQPEEATGEHRSEFVDVNGIVGYLNSDSNLSPLVFQEDLLLTLLHGPVLAKNPDLADKIILRMGWADPVNKTAGLKRLDELSGLSRKTAFEH